MRVPKAPLRVGKSTQSWIDEIDERKFVPLLDAYAKQRWDTSLWDDLSDQSQVKIFSRATVLSPAEAEEVYRLRHAPTQELPRTKGHPL